jgi:hypothetical protein
MRKQKKCHHKIIGSEIMAQNFTSNDSKPPNVPIFFGWYIV